MGRKAKYSKELKLEIVKRFAPNEKPEKFLSQEEELVNKK